MEELNPVSYLTTSQWFCTGAINEKQGFFHSQFGEMIYVPVEMKNCWRGIGGH